MIKKDISLCSRLQMDHQSRSRETWHSHDDLTVVPDAPSRGGRDAALDVAGRQALVERLAVTVVNELLAVAGREARVKDSGCVFQFSRQQLDGCYSKCERAELVFL